MLTTFYPTEVKHIEVQCLGIFQSYLNVTTYRTGPAFESLSGLGKERMGESPLEAGPRNTNSRGDPANLTRARAMRVFCVDFAEVLLGFSGSASGNLSGTYRTSATCMAGAVFTGYSCSVDVLPGLF
jgi:hypothetical protein